MDDLKNDEIGYLKGLVIHDTLFVVNYNKIRIIISSTVLLVFVVYF